MNSVPDWLTSALPPAAQHSGLAVAKLGSAGVHGKGGLALSSPAFRDGGELDPCFTADEEDAVAPPLEWSAPPPGTQELVVIVEDASTEGDEPRCHWLVWGLAGQRGKLLEGEVPPRTGKNSLGNSEWLLPDLPKGETHTFVFQLFALDLPLTLMPGASRGELLAALDGHVVASHALVAQYTKSDEEEADWNDDDFE
ncbi:YbhB/YbcL family Raf kinase inhibitor-like protein [Altererythrobacter arenosus]|uniref:YbhB/YbcL family Raf kinase inhibitor-like protein n=1 Tax=Altererythrobacter arenosus TaxID=3032592 RepID=UPI00324252BA